jgi:hypothetical protein
MGAVCLVLGPLLGLVSMFIVRSVSHAAADQAAAFTAHPAAAQLGLGVGSLAAVLLAGGVVWLARTTYQGSPWLAFAGGVLGVLGVFSVLYDDAVHLSAVRVVDGLDAGRAAALLHPLYSGGVVAVGPLSELGDVGVILLALAALRTGVPRWTAVVVCIGVVAEGAGFAIGTRYLAAVGFALVAIGFAGMLRTVLSSEPVIEPEMAAQHA